MLQLYFFPMACSLASRMALMEAGIEARYHLVHIWTKKVVDDGSDFRSVSPKGAVPVLVLENSERLTESPAVLQYIADLKPELGLAPLARRSGSLSPAGVAKLHQRRDPQGVPVSDLLV
jgi:glutathione S-transferase